MNMVITFDICSFFILAFLLFSLYLRKMSKGLSNHIFIIIVFIVLISSLADTAGIIYPALARFTLFSKAITYFFNYIYYFTHNAITPLYVLFIFSICGMWHDFVSKRLWKFLWGLPVVIDLIAIAVNPFFHNLFYITEELVYTRGPGISILYITAAYSYLLSIGCLIYKKSFISKAKFWLLLSLLPINLLSIGIQYIFPYILLETLGSSISILLVYIIVQRPEDIINMETESLNFYAYQDDVKKNFLARRKMYIIFIELSNYSYLHKQIRSSTFKNFMSDLIKKMDAFCKDVDETEIYYLYSGLFAVVSLDNDETELLKLAERLNIFFHQKVRIGIMEFMLTTKICFARCPQNLPDLNSVLSFGRNISELIYDTDKVVSLDALSLTSDFKIRNQINDILYRAIQNRSFQIYYQPIYDIRSGKFTSAEALVRLNDELFGFISPDVFIQVSEKSGAIHQIGDFIFEQVFEFITKENLKKYGVRYVEINLSIAQCIERNLYEKVRRYFDTYKITPDMVNFELTETAIDYSRELADKNIQMLHDFGIKFSLDDYGTGYSNIKRLTSLPFDIIKLDKTFADEFENPQMRVIIDGTVNMLKKLNKRILVEGVSEKKTMDYFTSLGCDHIQGFYFSKPLPEQEFLAFVKEHNFY